MLEISLGLTWSRSERRFGRCRGAGFGKEGLVPDRRETGQGSQEEPERDAGIGKGEIQSRTNRDIRHVYPRAGKKGGTIRNLAADDVCEGRMKSRIRQMLYSFCAWTRYKAEFGMAV